MMEDRFIAGFLVCYFWTYVTLVIVSWRSEGDQSRRALWAVIALFWPVFVFWRPGKGDRA